MNGILVIDKAIGMSSFEVVRRLRRLCRTRRIGHAGNLDPLATGVLPVAIGQATRLVEYLMAGAKTYQATFRMGIVTDTQDSEGRVLEEHPWQHCNRAQLDAVVASFIGEIQQMPPMYSALKKDGQPLYRLARQGIEVERSLRAVSIDSLRIDRFEPPDATLTVRCSKGTYVRTLCHDIGRQLGCGAHMTALRRLACGPFTLAASHSLEELEGLVEQGLPLPLVSPAAALADWPALTVEGAALERLRNGVPPYQADCQGIMPMPEQQLRFLAGDTLVAIARYTPGGQGKRQGDFEILKVFSGVDGPG